MRMLSMTLLIALAGCVSSTQHSVSSNDEAAGFNVQLGLGYLQQGNLVVAKEKLERAERESPRDPKVHNAMGLLYERLGDAKRADDEIRALNAELEGRVDEICALVLDGRLDVRIGGRFALADARLAHEALASRTTSGKLLLITGEQAT